MYFGVCIRSISTGILLCVFFVLDHGEPQSMVDLCVYNERITHIYQMLHSIIINFKLFQFQFAASKQTPVINYELAILRAVCESKRTISGREREREKANVIRPKIKEKISIRRRGRRNETAGKEKQTIMAIKTTATSKLFFA